MRKITSIVVICLILLSVIVLCVQAEQQESDVVDEYYEEYIGDENINHCFLPQAYDIGFTGGDERYMKNFIENRIIRDGDKIVVPPIVTKCDSTVNNVVSIDTAWGNLSLAEDYFEDKNMPLNENMLRTLYLGNESAIRSFVAPWTLYNAKTGELYSWPELMSMTDEELEAMDFEHLDFERFITNVKKELEVRDWWKNEYQHKYDILFSHKDDYKSGLDEAENFVIDDKVYNFAAMNYEFQSSGVVVENNITCVNIFSDDFRRVYYNTSDDIKEKYKSMFDAIDRSYTMKPHANIYEYIYGQTLECSYIIDLVPGLTDQEKNEIKSQYYNYTNANKCVFLQLINDYNVSEQQLRSAIDEFNYRAPFWQVYGYEMMNAFFAAENDYQAMSVLVRSNGIIVSEEHYLIMNVKAFSTKFGSSEFNINDMKKVEHMFEDVDMIIKQLNTKKYDKNYDINEFDEALKYLDSINSATPPSTGENTILYIAIASAALVSMVAMVVRRKREIVE